MQRAPPEFVTLTARWQGIGNGLPFAAVVTTPEIAQTLAQKLHFNTYGEGWTRPALVAMNVINHKFKRKLKNMW
jgi:acetylornithine/succinyldiaminopimelate/putrescine aminotransferase